MYAEPDDESAQITKVPEYSSVSVLEADKEGWTKIRYWDEVGYVETRALTKGWGVIEDVMDAIIPSETYKQVYNHNQKS
jgi:hypothetical protein